VNKPRIFLGSSSAQAPLLEAIKAGLDDIADVELWMTTFAEDDWTSTAPDATSGQASPRENVVFEAGLFGGAVGMDRTFILHARGAKLPTDLLGLTSIRYSDADEVDSIIAKLRGAIEGVSRLARIEGEW
jgi:predicted nucleotide-binding protein